MSKRLGGKKLVVPNRKPLVETFVYTLPSMELAIEKYRNAFTIQRFRTRWREVPEYRETADRMLVGDGKIESILEMAERLIEEALVIDPRLVKRSGWVRSEEGIDACANLVASGDDRPCFDWRKLRVGDAANAEPIRVVISTDSKEIRPENAAAFIAATKLAQQFRPLEVWWQGAWFMEEWRRYEGVAETGGHVFHVPLVQGDMDFRRLQFVLSDTARDAASFYIMVEHAYRAGYGWGAGVAERSYLPGTASFIRESGMRADADEVARYAAEWAGMESRWRSWVSGTEAEQYWRAESERPEWKSDPESEKRWRKESRERDKKEREQKRQDAEARMAAV